MRAPLFNRVWRVLWRLFAPSVIAHAAYVSQTSGIVDHAFLKNIFNGIAGYGVESGMTLSVTGSSMVVTIADGVVRTASGRVVYTSSTVTPDVGDATNPRMDAIIWDDDAGAPAVLAGTPTAESATQTRPPLTDLADPNDILLGVIYIPPAATVILSANVFDRRTIVDSFGGVYASWRTDRRVVGDYSAQGNTAAGTASAAGVGFYQTPVDASDVVSAVSGEPVMKFSVATAGTARLEVGGSGIATISPDNSPRMIARVLMPAASANVTFWLCGFYASSGTTSNGAYLRIVTTGNVFFVTRQGGSETTTDLGALSRTTVLGFEIESPDGGVTWICRDQNGTVLASHTANVPTAATALITGMAATTATAAVEHGVANMRVEGTFA